MTVYVNDRPVEILPGMTVRHALLGAGLLDRVDDLHRPRDARGSEVGLEGALEPESRIYLP
jgi:hypothetical protein